MGLNNSILEREEAIISSLLSSLAFLLPYSILLPNIAIIISSVFAIYLLLSGRKYTFSPLVILFLILFTLYLLSFIWTENIPKGLNILGRRASLIIFPFLFLFFYPYINKKTLHRILLFFVGGVLLFGSVLIIFSIREIILNKDPWYFFFTRNVRTQLHIISPISLPPPYFGIYLNLTIVFLLYFFRGSRILKLFFLLFSFVLLLINSAQVAIFSCAIIFYLYLLRLTLQKFVWVHILALHVLLVMFFIALFWWLKDLNALPGLQLSELGYWENPIYRVSRTFIEGDPVRKENWTSSLAAIKENWLLGTGIGDNIDVLQKYRDHSSWVYKEKYNSHNQFLDIGISLGVIGLGTLLLIYYELFKLSFLKRSFLLFNVTLIFCLSMVTENILARYHGIVLFCFVTLLLYSYLSKKNVENN